MGNRATDREHDDLAAAERDAPAETPAMKLGRVRRARRTMSRGRLALLLALLAAGGFLTLQVGRQVYQSYAIGERATEIRAEIAAIQDENLTLTAQLAYLRSEAYVTKEARRISNLGAPDERVLIIPPGAEAAPPADLAAPHTPEPMLEQWVELFFGS